jgi:hypothetical protein
MGSHRHRQAKPPEHRQCAPGTSTAAPLQRRPPPRPPRNRMSRKPIQAVPVPSPLQHHPHLHTSVISDLKALDQVSISSRRRSQRRSTRQHCRGDRTTVPSSPNSPPRVSHPTSPWLAISPTMGVVTRGRGQHHASPLGRHRHVPPSFPTQKAHQIYPVATSTSYPRPPRSQICPPIAAEAPPLHGRHLGGDRRPQQDGR